MKGVKFIETVQDSERSPPSWSALLYVFAG